jgi:hypothetical protein
MKNRFFRLPFAFDLTRLIADLETCRTVEWPQHFNKTDYSGQWSSIALRSASGTETDIRAHPGAYLNTPLMRNCPYFQHILDLFDCPKEAVRLLALAPGSRIHEHRDSQTSYEYGFFRIHIPIETGNDVAFRVDGTVLPMAAGECWYANFDLLHSVHNNGRCDRVHLVLDCRRNAWSDELFEEAGYDFSEEHRNHQPSSAMKQQIIAELNRQNTETARKLIDQLSTEPD